jgi:hypothetical protein
MLKVSSLVVLGIWSCIPWAMPIKSEMLKPRAYFQEADNNLLEALDLKAKTLTFTKADFEQCGQSLVRQAQTLNFSCTLPIPTKARLSRLQRLVGASVREVAFGGTRRDVKIQVAEDARSITISTAFDIAGIDFEIHKFNDDFFPVYAKVAHLVISEALAQPVRLEVLENRNDQPVAKPSGPALIASPKTEKAPSAPRLNSQNKKKKISSVDFSN